MSSRPDDFEELFQAHVGEVQRLVSLHAHNPEDRQDLVQEVFLRAYGAFSRFRGDSSVSTWLHRITINVCIDASRSRARRKELSLDDTEITACSSGLHSVVEFLAGREEQQMLRQALRSLSPEQIAVLSLRFSDQLSVPEISEVLGIPFDTAKTRLRSALAKLQSSLTLLNLVCSRDGTDGKPATFDSLDSLDERSAQLYFSLGSLYLRKGLVEAALMEWRKAQEVDPSFLDPYLASANEYVRISKPSMAVSTLEQAVSVVHDGKLHADLAMVYLDMGELDEGMAHSLRAVELKPDSPDTQYSAGRAFYRQAEIQDALRLGAGANTTVIPPDASWKQAASHLRRAVRLQPGFTKARESLAMVYLNDGAPSKALSEIRAALTAEGETEHLLNRSGWICYQSRKYKLAERYLKRSIELGRTYWKLHMLGLVYGAMEREEDAIESYAEALPFTTHDWQRALIHSNTASSYVALKKADDAILAAEAALALCPDHVHARCNLAKAHLMRKSDPELVIAISREGLSYGLNHICFHDHLAEAFFRLGRFEEALPEATTAIELDPKISQKWVRRARILLALGQYDEARSDAGRAIEVDPDDTEARDILDRMPSTAA